MYCIPLVYCTDIIQGEHGNFSARQWSSHCIHNKGRDRSYAIVINVCLYYEMSLVLARIRVSWAASGSLLKFPLYDFNDYDDEWGGGGGGAFEIQQVIDLNKGQLY